MARTQDYIRRIRRQGRPQVLFRFTPPPPAVEVTGRSLRAISYVRAKIPGMFMMLYIPRSTEVRPNEPGRIHVWTYKVQSRRNR